MSQSQEQSYYEIALTNRQVLSIFVVLLVCILGAFLGGVWLARGAEARVEMAEAQSITAATLSKGDPLAPIEELDFFDRREDAQPIQKSPGTVQTEDQPPAQDAETPAPTVRQAPPPAVKVEVPAASQTRRDSPKKKAAPEPKRTTTPSSATTADQLVVQVFSSNDQAQAQRVVEQLRKGGYPAHVSPVDVDTRTLYRVRIGPYTDRDEAQVVADAVGRTFKLDTWITH